MDFGNNVRCVFYGFSLGFSRFERERDSKQSGLRRLMHGNLVIDPHVKAEPSYSRRPLNIKRGRLVPRFTFAHSIPPYRIFV